MATIERGTLSHITHGNDLNTHDQWMTTNTWTHLMDSVSQELTWVASIREHPKKDPASWKLTGEEKSMPTTQVNTCSLKLTVELMKPIQMDACSLNLIGYLMIQVFPFTWSTLTMIEWEKGRSVGFCQGQNPSGLIVR